MSSERQALIPSASRRAEEGDGEGGGERSMPSWVTIAGTVIVIGSLAAIVVVFSRDKNVYPPSSEAPDHDHSGPAWDLPEPHFAHEPISESLSWTPCAPGDKVQCARLVVPLDYDNPSMGTANLAVGMIPHTKEPRRGMLFTNPGGPGAAGATGLYYGGEELVAYLGGQYDLVSFDPRGTGNSTPLATCFNSVEDERRFYSASPLDLDLPTTLPGSRWDKDNVSETELLSTLEERYYDKMQTVAWASRKCRENNPGIWDWMDTASVTKDIIRLQDLMEGEGTDVNYWGFSYGSILGQYLANMFPDRVGRVLLDGVFDAERWGGQPAARLAENQYRSDEDALAAFCTWCAEASSACPLTQGIRKPTAETICDRIDSFIVELEENPRPLDLFVSSHQMYLKAGDLQNALFIALYAPGVFFVSIAQSLSRAFLGSDSGSGSGSDSTSEAALGALELYNLTHSFPSNESGWMSWMPWAEFGVECSDTLRGYAGEPRTLREAARESAVQTWHLMQDVSPHFTGSSYCPAWLPKQGGRPWHGPWSTRVKGRVLVIANEADPICPLFEARKVFAHFHQDATLLVLPTVGHCSMGEPSMRQAKIIRQWLNEDVLPPRGQVISCDSPQVNPWLRDKGEVIAAHGMEDEDDATLTRIMTDLAETWASKDRYPRSFWR